MSYPIEARFEPPLMVDCVLAWNDAAVLGRTLGDSVPQPVLNPAAGRETTGSLAMLIFLSLVRSFRAR